MLSFANTISVKSSLAMAARKPSLRSKETLPSLLRKLIIAWTSVDDDLRDSIVHLHHPSQVITSYGSKETIPLLLCKLIIVWTSVDDDFRDSVRYVFITTRRIGAPDYNAQHHFDRLATVCDCTLTWQTAWAWRHMKTLYQCLVVYRSHNSRKYGKYLNAMLVLWRIYIIAPSLHNYLLQNAKWEQKNVPSLRQRTYG